MTEPSSSNREYGGRIREARIAAGLSQGDLAATLGCTQAQVSRLEAGKRTQTVEHLLRVADAAQCDPCWLLTGCRPLNAPVRLEPHLGDPVTITAPDKIHTAHLSAGSASVRARAKRLLLRVATHGEEILDNITDPLDIPGYLLDSLTRAGDALVRLAELDAQQPAQVEIVLDGTGDLWVRVSADEDKFECLSSHDEDQSLEQIVARFGIARQFVAAPPGR